MEMNTSKVLTVTIVSFALYFLLREVFFTSLNQYLISLLKIKSLSYFLTYFIVGCPFFLGLLVIHKTENFFDSIGLNQGFVKGTLVAFICTLPMLMGYSLVFDFNSEITWNEILRGAFFAALFEELFFRGVLFGQLYRFTRLGFIPSIIIGAILFASGHLYQSQEITVLIGIFITTFLGAILFAWAYIEWGNNIWVPIGLHLFMNLFWMLFSAGDNALGGIYSNVFRLITIALIIIGTFHYKKKME